MEVREIKNKEIWEGFLGKCQEKTFLQSWNWGEFCQQMNEKIWRLGIFDKDNLLAVALTEKKVARRGTFLLVPHGPVVELKTNSKPEILKSLTEELKTIGKREGVSFVRINPIWPRTKEGTGLFKNLGFKQAPLKIHPEASWKLDLRPSEKELFTKMRKTSRYLIRQAQKNDQITFSQSQDFKDIELFSRFHDQVSKRQSFIPFSLEYLQKEKKE